MPKSLKEYEDSMEKTIVALEQEFSNIRAGRANPNILNRVQVNYYGVPTPIKQVANIVIPEARIIQITPWEANILKEVEKGIIAANLGLNPTNDGKNIRLIIPELTEERREELSKEVKKIGENSKVSIRNIRRDAIDDMKKFEKKSEISEDQLKDLEDEIQELTDKFVEQIEKEIEEKTKDIMTV